MISVVIPTQNRSDLLQRAIKSVQNQTYSDLEIIVVSDGSTDNTEEIMKKYTENDSRIRFISYYPARGGNVARNTGINEAKGEYIAFLDDDDEWYPEKICKQLAVFESDSEVGLVYTGVHVIYVNEKVEYNTKVKLEGNLAKQILFDNYIGTTSTVMVKKDVLNLSGTFDTELKALQDFELWIRICQICKVGVVQEEQINYYNYTNKTQVSSSTQKYIDAFEYINKKHTTLFNQFTSSEKLKKVNNEYMLLANKAMRNGTARVARRYILKSMKIKFSIKNFAYWFLSFFNYKTVLKVRSKM